MRALDLSDLHVLIVDDSQNMRQILRLILRAFGLREVAEAENGAQALKMMPAFVPDVVITNWEMAPVNGLELVRALRGRENTDNPFIPIIMVSGHGDRHHVIEARNVGITEFLAKPVSAAELYGRIVKLVDNPRMFVKARQYFGPDRRDEEDTYSGAERRKRNENHEGDGSIVVEWKK